MITCEMTTQERKQAINSLFKGYRRMQSIPHILILPRTPWHNRKVERSHRNDQRYFYDWEKFNSLNDFNRKLAKHT